MYKLLKIVLLVAIGFTAYGQGVPQKINYQAVAHNSSGDLLINQSLTVTIGVLSGSSTGTLVYEEEHSVSTNEYGLFYLKIGEGIPSTGSMVGISWEGADHFLNVKVNGDDLGTTQLVSVPYALASRNTSGINGNGISNTNVNDGDVLVFNGTSGQWEAQPIGSASETTTTLVDNTDGTFTYTNELGTPITFDANIDDLDADPNNEIQDLQLIGDSLFITNNGSATAIDLGPYRDLPPTASTGDILTWSGSAWIAGVDQVDDLDNDPNNEIELPATAVTGDVLMWNGSAWVAQVNTGSGIWTDAGSSTYMTGITDYVGIGTINPLANLNVVGADPGHMARFENSNNAGSSSIIFADDAGAEQLYFGFANTGYSSGWNGHGYISTVQDLVFAKNNGERMRLGAGGFGIGTSSPDATLDVVGNFQLQDGTEAAGYVLTSDATGLATWQPTGGSAWELSGNSGTINGTDFIGTTDAQNLDIRTNNIIHHRFTQQGQIEFLNTGESVFIGQNAGTSDDLSTNQNVAIGQDASFQNTTGSLNTAVGHQAMFANTVGAGNTAFGATSMFSNQTGNSNSVLGYGALSNSTSPEQNTAIGANALVNTNGSKNAALGIGSGVTNTTGLFNTFIGAESDASVGNLVNATAIGYQAIVGANNSIVLGNNANVGIGTSAPSELLYMQGTDADLDIETNDNIESSSIHLRKSRGTPAARTLPTSIDYYANIQFQGFDGTDYTTGARIEGSVDGTPSGPTDMPGKLVFYTTQDGTGTDAERMRISNTGNVGIGNNNPSAKLDVIGNVKIVDGTQGAGKVFTSDATGNGSWKTKKVAFFAGSSTATDQSIAQNNLTTLLFQNSGSSFTLNDGGGYSPTTGFFTAPVAGVYNLNANLLFAGAPSGYFTIELMHSVNGSIAQNTGMFNTIAQNWFSGTIGSTVHLNAGESVWIEVYNTNGSMTFYNGESTFSGHLVYAD
jgi:hypothetical protein